MSIETVSVEQTTGNTMKLKWKGEMGWGNGFEVWSRRSPSGCGDAIWPTGGRVQPPGRGGVVAWLFWFRSRQAQYRTIKCTQRKSWTRVFNRWISCLPTPKPAAKKLKQEDVQLKYFMENDTIRSINEFDPEKRTAEKYYNVVTSRQKYEIVYSFMTQDLLSTEKTIILYCSQCW